MVVAVMAATCWLVTKSIRVLEAKDVQLLAAVAIHQRTLCLQCTVKDNLGRGCEKKQTAVGEIEQNKATD